MSANNKQPSVGADHPGMEHFYTIIMGFTLWLMFEAYETGADGYLTNDLFTIPYEDYFEHETFIAMQPWEQEVVRAYVKKYSEQMAKVERSMGSQVN